MSISKKQVEEIRERIRTLRIDKGYSQDYMADMLNISQNAYHKLEKGYTRIHLEKFIDIAKILEVDFSELLKGSNYVYVFSGQYKKNILNKFNPIGKSFLLYKKCIFLYINPKIHFTFVTFS